MSDESQLAPHPDYKEQMYECLMQSGLQLSEPGFRLHTVCSAAEACRQCPQADTATLTATCEPLLV